MLPVWKTLVGWVSRCGVRWFKSLPPVLSFRVSRICFGGISGYEGHDRGPSKWLSLCCLVSELCQGIGDESGACDGR